MRRILRRKKSQIAKKGQKYALKSKPKNKPTMEQKKAKKLKSTFWTNNELKMGRKSTKKGPKIAPNPWISAILDETNVLQLHFCPSSVETKENVTRMMTQIIFFRNMTLPWFPIDTLTKLTHYDTKRKCRNWILYSKLNGHVTVTNWVWFGCKRDFLREIFPSINKANAEYTATTKQDWSIKISRLLETKSSAKFSFFQLYFAPILAAFQLQFESSFSYLR